MTLTSSNDSEVVQLQEFCGVSKQQAIVLLNKHKTLEAAANAFFTDPNAALRDEPPQNNWVQADNLPSFQIEADGSKDVPAMSRPPSRIDDRANLDAAVGQQFDHQQNSQDDDLQRAIALSRQGLPSQESGVTEPNQQFGPATRAYYDASQWAVTPIATTRELFDHPPPSKRRRLAGQPAFLCGSRESGYLASLLNIYHNIPLARQAFLFPSFRVQSYGYDPSWWSGTSDENNKSLSVEESGSPNSSRYDFLAELQCLMAFLSNTTRAYGSVDALADLYALKSFASESPFSRFIESWIHAGVQQNPDERLTQIFTSEALKASSDPQDGYLRKEFHVLDAPIELPFNPTLTDLMDNIIWHDSMGTVDDAWMERCAQVFSMHLYGSSDEGSGTGLDVPPFWYPERYMSAYKDAAREMRREVLQFQKQIQNCDLLQKRLRLAKLRNKRTIPVREVLETAAQLSMEMASDNMATSSPNVGAQIQSQLLSVLLSLDQKLENLERQKDLLQRNMIQVSRSLATPTEGTSHGRSPYVLQGVSTKPNITYVRVRSTELPKLIDLDEAAPSQEEWTWWRFEWFDSSAQLEITPRPQTQAEAIAAEAGSTPYTVREVSEQAVLTAARDEHDSVVLVYADQQAIGYEDPVVPSSLRKFVEQDNRAFRAELDEEAGLASKPSSPDTSTTMSDDDAHGSEAGMTDHRDTTPMSITSPIRHVDGDLSIWRSNRDTAHVHHVNTLNGAPFSSMNADRTTADANSSGNGTVPEQTLPTYSEHVPDQGTGPVHIEHSQTPLR